PRPRPRRRPQGGRPVGRAHRRARRPAGRGLRPRLREPRPGGRGHHRPPPRADLRLRPRARRPTDRAAPGRAARLPALPGPRPRAARRHRAGVAGLGPPRQRVALRAAARPRRAPARPPRPRRPPARRPGRAARRRARPARPVVRRAAPLHALGPPAADRRGAVARGPPARPRRLPDAGPGVQRYVAAAELGSGQYTNPVVPEDAASALRGARMGLRAWAPGRVNLIGDHTDYMGGLVLPMAIGLGIEIAGDRGGNWVMLGSDRFEGVAEVPVSGVPDPSTVEPTWGRYVAAVVDEVRPDDGLVGMVHSTLPPGSGLASSAALEVAVATALGAVRLDPVAAA